jgi:hypothetical protein
MIDVSIKSIHGDDNDLRQTVSLTTSTLKWVILRKLARNATMSFFLVILATQVMPLLLSSLYTVAWRAVIADKWVDEVRSYTGQTRPRPFHFRGYSSDLLEQHLNI